MYPLIAGLTLALIVNPTYPTLVGRINDFADKLNHQEEQKLDLQLIGLNKTHNVQCVIAIVPSLQGLTIDSYALILADKWAIDNNVKGKGIVIVVAPQERKARVIASSSTEGEQVLSTQEAQRVVDAMTMFWKGWFPKPYKGFEAGIAELDRILKK
jgi:uncharacterized membrane protein YgcG